MIMSNIGKVKNILKKNNFNESDYVISLQGPTVIFTKTGQQKISNDLDVLIELSSLIKIITISV